MRELSVVVIGILITFQGSAWIERSRQRSQNNDILAMVETELNKNLEELRRSEVYLVKELEGMAFFAGHMDDIESAPRDSVDMFVEILGAGLEFFYSSNALEVLKTSPGSLNVMDKEMLRMIFLCYDEIDIFFSSLNNYYKRKFETVASFYFSIDRRTIEAMQRKEDPYPFLKMFLENISTGNLVLHANENLGPKVRGAAELKGIFEETVETIAGHAGGKKREGKKRPEPTGD